MRGSLSSDTELDFLRRRLYRAEEELRFKSEALDHSLNGFDVLDTEGRFLYANQAFLDMWGYQNLEQLQATPIRQLYCDPETLEHLLKTLEQADQCVLRFEARRRDGSVFDAMMYARVSQNEQQRRVLTRSTIDVSQHTLAQRRHHEAERLEALGRLAGGVAHDFNNLLTVINGNSDLFLTDYAHRSEGADFIVEIAQAGRQAAALTAQLLAFSKQSPADSVCCDVNGTVIKMKSMFERVIGENIEIQLELEEQPCTILIGASQLEQVLMNLVINARDAMPCGGRLQIRTSQIELQGAEGAELPAGQYVRLEVSDTGHGLDPKLQTRIFEPFFTTKQAFGTGLGLATVYGIVQQAGGAIEVCSPSGKGTTFSIHFPRHHCQPTKRESPRPAFLPGNGQETILLVEDDKAVRQIAKRILTKLKYNVLEAADGQSALEVARQHKSVIDLLLTDVVMPGLGGVPLSQELRQSRPSLKVLFVSGYNTELLSKSGLEPGDFRLLSKPYNLRELSTSVRQALEE